MGAYAGHIGVFEVLFDLLSQIQVVALFVENARNHETLGLGEIEVTGGDVDDVGLAVHQLGELHSLFQGKAAVHVLGAAHADLDDVVRPTVLAHPVNNHQQQAAAVFDAAPEAVRTVVGGRGEELVDQPAVAGVDHGHVKAADLRLLSSPAKGLHHCLNHLLGHGQDLALAVDRLT